MEGAERHDFIDRYNDAWNVHDVDAIVAMHTEDSVFENQVTGDVNVGREQIGAALRRIFAVFPDHCPRHARGHDDRRRRRGRADGRKVEYKGMDVIPVRDGLVVRRTSTRIRSRCCGNSA